MSPRSKTCFVSMTVNLHGMTVDRRTHGGDHTRLFGSKGSGRYVASTGAARLFELFSELDLKTTVFVPGQEAEQHPELIRAIAADDHEIAANGYAHEDYTGAPEEDELLARTHEILSKLTGKPPIGWRAPTGILRPTTLSALEKLGYQYDASNQDDDFPYSLQNDGGGRMMELPQQEILIDATLYDKRASHQKLLKWWHEEFMALYAERCYVQFTVSPRADNGSGRASRIAVLGDFIRHLQALPAVQFMTCEEMLGAVQSKACFARP